MRAPRPVLALLTDFGLRDHYVAAMKGVILGICPDAQLIDITHDIPPQDIAAGAIELGAVAPYLPAGTVVLAVVDPGVGTARRAVAVETGRLTLVGPDNGLFTWLLRSRPDARAVELSNARFHRSEMSRTFEGRDRFAPVAAHLANGTALAELGPPAEALLLLDVPVAVEQGGLVRGDVLCVDRFGNLITNIERAALTRLGPDVVVRVGGQTLQLLSAYGDARPGEALALVGSSERLEIAVNGGSAARHLGLGAGASVSVLRSGAA